MTTEGLFTRYVDHGDEGAVIVRGQFVAPIVDDAKERHNAGYWGPKDWRHVARIPNILVEHYCNINGVTLREFVANPEHMKRLCNDSGFADVRIWPGKL
jgi:hypothetical protein